MGDEVKIHGSPWKIVGVLKGNGGFFDDALVTDSKTLPSALPQATYSAVDAVLESPASLAELKQAITSDPALKAKVLTESEANETVIKSLRHILDFVSYFIGGSMAIGAVCAALIGAAAAWVLFNGNVVNAGGLTFQMTVTPHLLVVSICWALGIALIGGSLPAIRAASLPVATALRAS